MGTENTCDSTNCSGNCDSCDGNITYATPDVTEPLM